MELPQKIVVVGGVAGGMSAAARARRLSEDAHIVVLERDRYVSFANCGMPYHIGGDIADRSALLVQTPASLAANLNLDVRVGNEVVAIDPTARSVTVRDLQDDRTYTETYDKLVLATGAFPLRPPLPGIDYPFVKTLRSLEDMDAIKEIVDLTDGGRAVVIGGGYIGIEMAEALRHRRWEVALLEAADQILGPLDREMAEQVQHELRRNGVELHLGARAEGFTQDSVLTSDGVLPADLVIMAVGVAPDSRLAQLAGLETTERGAIVVDAQQRTSDPDIYAVGDSVQVTDTVTGECTVVPLAGPANRQGRIAADHMFGRDARYSSTQGTSIVKAFDVTAGGTGANEKQLRAAGIDYRKVYIHPNGHASYYPGTAAMHLKLLFSPDGTVLGGQVVGYDGVDKRIDVLAVAIRAGLTVWDLAELELAYAPPYGSAKDPINMAGFQASNLLDGTVDFWYPEDWGSLPDDAVVLDVRTLEENQTCALPDSVNIPVQELRDRVSEIDPARPVYVYCRSGFRSYLAYRALKGLGFPRVATLSGGTMTMEHAVPWLAAAFAAPAPVVTYAEDDRGCALQVLDEVPFASR